MTLEDFVGSFTDMSICHLVRSGWFQLGRTLVEQSFFGEWTVGERGTPLDRAGGCINHRDSFLRNPQVGQSSQLVRCPRHGVRLVRYFTAQPTL